MKNKSDLTLDILTAPDGMPLPSEQLAETLLEYGHDTIFLSFSRGKDCIAMWLFLRQYNFNIIPYYMYWIPDLQFEEESLQYYEDWFGQAITRLPHPYFWKYLNSYLYQIPEHVAVIRAAGIPDYDFADLEKGLAVRWGLPEDIFSAVGFRAADNIDRRNLIKQKGAVGFRHRRWYHAIWDWNIERTAGIINESGIKLPIDYKVFGRTIAAWDYQYLKPLRDNFPEDYQRILDWFPLLEAEFFRHEQIKVQNGKA